MVTKQVKSKRFMCIPKPKKDINAHKCHWLFESTKSGRENNANGTPKPKRTKGARNVRGHPWDYVALERMKTA